VISLERQLEAEEVQSTWELRSDIAAQDNTDLCDKLAEKVKNP